MTEATNLRKAMTDGAVVALTRGALNRRACRCGDAIRRSGVVTVSGGSLTI
jgi:hypothetical protein